MPVAQIADKIQDLEDNKLRLYLLNMWRKVHPKIEEKFKNLTGKTSMGSVPEILWQKRMSKINRVLIPLKTVIKSGFTYDQLKSFYGSVCVEFVNDDYFNPDFQNLPIFNELKELIDIDGSCRVGNGKISAIISFRTEDGDSGAALPRDSYLSFIQQNPFELIPITRNEDVINNLLPNEGIGWGNNRLWKGNAFWSIKGGSQQGEESHPAGSPNTALFNPAIDYANPHVCLDIVVTMSFFAMHCHDIPVDRLTNIGQENLDFASLKDRVESYLRTRRYQEGNRNISLYDYCMQHDTLTMDRQNFLIDPIQFKRININWFSPESNDSGTENEMELCHNESVNNDKFYFDNEHNFILTPQRPTNLFWATSNSNMMQQNYTLNNFWDRMDDFVAKRRDILNNQRNS